MLANLNGFSNYCSTGSSYTISCRLSFMLHIQVFLERFCPTNGVKVVGLCSLFSTIISEFSNLNHPKAFQGEVF